MFVFLLCFLAAIFATQIFRGQIPQESDDGESIQVPFFDIYNAFLGMYQIFSSENWTDIMYNVTSYNVAWNNGWIGAAFCILWFVLANCKFACPWSAYSKVTDVPSHCVEHVYCCHSREL